MDRSTGGSTLVLLLPRGSKALPPALGNGAPALAPLAATQALESNSKVDQLAELLGLSI